MDDVFLYIIGGAIIAVFIIILNHKKQKSKVDSFLKDARTAQPVFMQASIDKKLKTLKVALYGNTTGIQLEGTVMEGGALHAAEAKKQSLINQLEQLEKNYAGGGVTMKAYDDQLHGLIKKLSD
jgi:hypothetical protein